MEELTKLFKKKTNVLIAVGVVLILVFSLVAFLIFGSSSSKNSTSDEASSAKVGVLDEQTSDEEAILNDVLGGLGGRIIKFSSEKELRDAIGKNQIDIALIFTFGFSSGGSQTATVTVYYDPSSVTSSQVNQAVQQALQNYSQQSGQQIVVQAVVVNPPGSSGGSGSGGAGGNSGSGNSSSGESSPTKPRRVP